MQRGGKLLLTAGCLAVFGLFLLGSFLFLSHAPSVGISVAWDEGRNLWFVASAAPGSGFQNHDGILRIGGIQVEHRHLLSENDFINTNGELFSWFRAKGSVHEAMSRPEVTFLIERAGRERQLTVKPHRTGLAFLNSYRLIHTFVLGAGFLLIGIMVLNRIALKGQGLVFFLMCMDYAFTMLTIGIPTANVLAWDPSFFLFLHIFNLCVYFFSSILALHFSLIFPHRRRFLDRFPALPWLFYASNGLIAVFFNLVVIDHLVPIYYALSFIALGYALFAYRDPVERQQMKWVAAGFLFGLGPWICINGIPLLLTGRYLMPDVIPGSFLICIPLFTAFAIEKYRLFDIDTLFEGTIVYSMTIALLGVIDFGFLALLGSTMGAALFISPTGKGLLSILLVVSLYAPLRNEVRLLIRRLFRRDAPEEGALIRAFTAQAVGRSPQTIARLLESTVRSALRPRDMILLTRDRGETLDAFSGQNEPIRLWEMPWAERLPYRGMLVALPLGRDGSVEHVLLLGELSSGKFYARHDLTVLKTLSKQAHLLYENALLYEENIRQANALLLEERRSAREREKILKDLHDGLGGITTNIGLLAEMGRSTTSTEDTRKMFSTIAELSRESHSEIRSFLYSMDSREMTWEALAADLRHFGTTTLEPHSIAFTMQTSLDGGEKDPDRFLCLAVFRIYKEALANVIKHAGAHVVCVDLTVDLERLSLSIRDDGAGIARDHVKGRGLANMAKRADEIGGTLMVLPGSGTRVALEVPLPVKYPGEVMGEREDLV